MKSVKLNVDSWHYKLAKQWADYSPDVHGSDMCTYMRKVLRGLIVGGSVCAIFAALAVAGFVIVTNMIVAPFSYFFLVKVYGDIIGAIICWSFTAMCLIYGFTSMKIAEYKELRQDMVSKPDSFIKSAYESWKGKYCVKLDLVDNTGAKYETNYQRYNREYDEHQAAIKRIEDSNPPTTTGSAP